MKIFNRYLMLLALAFTGVLASWAQDEVTVSPTANANEWTLEMPDADVELEVEYFTDIITVYFTDAQNYGDVKVYFWPDGRAWPGEAMTEVETNEFGQKIYKAVIPAGTQGIIFNNNNNGKQTVNITENISKNAWWYTTDATDGSGHNQVVYNDIYIELTKGDGNSWTFEMPEGDVELEIEYEDEPTYYVVGTMTDPAWTIDAANELQPNTETPGEYYIHNMTLTNGTEFKVVSSIDNGATIKDWFPASGGNYQIPLDATYSIYFRPDGQGGSDWHYGVIYAQTTAVTLDEESDNTDILTELDGKTVDVTLKRTLREGGWNTFAVPFSISTTDYSALQTLLAAVGGSITVKELTGSSFANGKLTMNFATATSIEAGKPYLVKVSGDIDLATLPAVIDAYIQAYSPGITNPFKGTLVSKTVAPKETDAVDFIPTLGKTTIMGDNPKSVLFIGAGSQLMSPETLPADMKGFRAYFQLKGDAAQAQAFTLNFGDDVTGIRPTPNPSLNGGEWYDLSGRKLDKRPATKGVYIVNGKKTVIK